MIRLRTRSRSAAATVAVVATAGGVLVLAASASGLFASRPAVPPAKQAVLDRIHPPANPGPPVSKGPNAKAVPRTTIRPPEHAGIVGTPDQLGGVPVPFPADVFHVTNMWLDLQAGVFISIYAGSLGSDPDQGAIVVERINGETGRDLPGSGLFPTPTKAGPVTLTVIRGSVVYFTNRVGNGTFNLVTDAYSS